MKKPKKLDNRTVEMFVRMLREEGMIIVWKRRLIYVTKLPELIDSISQERMDELVYRNGFKVKLNVQYKLF